MEWSNPILIAEQHVNVGHAKKDYPGAGGLGELGETVGVTRPEEKEDRMQNFVGG